MLVSIKHLCHCLCCVSLIRHCHYYLRAAIYFIGKPADINEGMLRYIMVQESIRTGNLSKSMYNSNRSQGNHTKNRTLVTCTLSNINKMAIFTQRVQCVLLYLVIMVVKSAWFRILRSHTLLHKSPVLMRS